MDNKSPKIEPWINIQHRPGNTVIAEWQEKFDDKAGHTGTAWYCTYRDKKGQEHTIMRYIRWD